MKQYKIQNRSQKNSQSCVPLSKTLQVPLRRKIKKNDMQVSLSPTSNGSDSTRVNEGLIREKK
jgi:hypothetical protein